MRASGAVVRVDVAAEGDAVQDALDVVLFHAREEGFVGCAEVGEA